MVLFAMLLTILLAFGALAIDGSVYRFGQVEAQDVADTAAHAAVLTLKRTGSRTEAELAARTVVAENTIAGMTAEFEGIEFGNWDTDARMFVPALGVTANSVKVQVGRTGEEAIGFGLAPVMGYTSAEIVEPAVAATRSLEVALVIDITGSWSQKDFAKAREASLAFLDVLHGNHGEDDVVGMAVFFQRYAWEFTPFTSVADSASNPALIRDDWDDLQIGSLAGAYQSTWATGSYLNSKHIPCKVFGTNNSGGVPWDGWCTSGGSCYQASKRDKHTQSSPTGGCFPAMPRYFSDEGGTDHTTGLEMARTMFSERSDSTAYRALVVLTDGQPVGYTGNAARAAQGYTETRWREYKRATNHTTSQIKTDTPVVAQDLYEDLGVNVWFVSFVEHHSFMEDAAQGEGWFELAETSDEIVEIFEQIAHSLPVAVVE